MNVYDFDETIYSNDSTIDFIKFCLRNYKKTFLALPGGALGLGLFTLRVISKKSYKQRVFRFLKHVPDIDSAIEAFWDKNEKKIHSWYLDQKKSNDVIISASPEFLLAPICQKLDVKLIASRVDKHTGVFTGENCYGAEKVKRFELEFDISEIDDFYSDSLTDKPLADLAKKAYFIRDGKITDWKF